MNQSDIDFSLTKTVSVGIKSEFIFYSKKKIYLLFQKEFKICVFTGNSYIRGIIAHTHKANDPMDIIFHIFRTQ